MHLLGKSFEAFAVTPDGKTIPLVKIPKWDFRWQYFYTFPKMLKIPKGSPIAAIGSRLDFAAAAKAPSKGPFSKEYTS